MPPAFLRTWTDQQTKKLDAALAKMDKVLASSPVKGSAGEGKWECKCGFGNYSFRVKCKACGCDKCGGTVEAQARVQASAAPVAMQIDSKDQVLMASPEQEVKELENLLKVLKSSTASAKKDLLVASLQEQLQAAKEKVLQARPLPVRLQAAVKQQEAASAAVRAAEEALEQARLVFDSKQKALMEAKCRLQQAEVDVAEVQAQLGRPQLEAGAAAAVTVCTAMLQQQGMPSEQLKAFDLAF